MRSASSDAASSGAAAGTSGSSYDLPPGAESVITQVRDEEEKRKKRRHREGRRKKERRFPRALDGANGGTLISQPRPQLLSSSSAPLFYTHTKQNSNQVTSLEIQAPSASQATNTQHHHHQQHQQQRRRRRRHRRHHRGSPSRRKAGGGPLQRFFDALRSTLCFCFPSALDQEDQEGEEGDDETGGERRRRRGGGGSSGRASASAAAGGGPSRSPGSATSSAAGSAASVGGGSAGSDLLFLPPAPPPAPPFEGPPVIGPRSASDAASGKKTLVLDLDETLVHSTLGPGPVALTSPEAPSGISGVGGRKGQPPPPGAVSRFSFDVALAGRTHAVHVRTRPHLLPFLERCARLFEVVVFTASQKVYAEQLLDVIDPGRRLIRHRVFRDSCVVFEGNYLKDLSALGRDLARVVIVDNSPQAFGFQLDNGIPIESWYDDDRDDELRRLLPLLESLAVSEDVRPLLASAFQLRKLVERAPSLAPASFLA